MVRGMRRLNLSLLFTQRATIIAGPSIFVLEAFVSATECVKIVNLSCGFNDGVNRGGKLILHLLAP